MIVLQVDPKQFGHQAWRDLTTSVAAVARESGCVELIHLGVAASADEVLKVFKELSP